MHTNLKQIKNQIKVKQIAKFQKIFCKIFTLNKILEDLIQDKVRAQKNIFKIRFLKMKNNNNLKESKIKIKVKLIKRFVIIKKKVKHNLNKKTF